MNKYTVLLINGKEFTVEADDVLWGDDGCIRLIKNREHDDNVVGVFPTHSLVGIVKDESSHE